MGGRNKNKCDLLDVTFHTLGVMVPNALNGYALLYESKFSI